MLRPTPIHRYLAVMDNMGFTSAQVTDGTRIDIGLLDTAQYLIETSQYHRLVDNMIALSGDEGLGLDIGLSHDVRDFGILGWAALVCRTPRQSVEEFWTYYGGALGMMASIAIPPGSSDTVRLAIDAPAMSPSAYRFFVEEALCLLMKVGGQVCGVVPRFIGLQISYAAPAYAERYREIFRCPIEFGMSSTQVTLLRSWFEMPMKASDPELIHTFKQHLGRLCRQIEASSPLVSRLRGLFVRQNGAVPSLGEAARELGVSARTLRRHLQQEGQSYRKAVSRYRADLALGYLNSGPAAAKQLSGRVGFKDINAFRRAFKAWTGKTISQYRGENK